MKNTIIICLCMIPFLLQAQQKRKITGVIQSANGQPLSGVSILSNIPGEGTQSDERGMFSITTAAAQLFTNFQSYQPDTLNITPKTVFWNVTLQETSKSLSEVVVSYMSNRRRNILSNPIAISHITGKQIEQTESSNIIDALVKNTPGLNAVQTGPNISKPFIRGLGYNRVLTLYNGIRQEGQQWGDEHGIEIDAYSIDGSDVIKGPASLMYGSDAEAGVVSIRSFVPAIADGKIHGKYTTEYQTNNNLIGNGAALYQRNNSWYWLASGSYRMAKNFRNAVDGRVYNSNFKEANAAFSLGKIFKQGSSSLNFTLYNNLQGIPDGSRDSLSRKFTEQVAEGDNDDIKNRPIVPDDALNSYALSPLHQHIQHYRIYSNNQFHFTDGGTVEILIAGQQNIRREYNHPTQPEQAGMFVRLNTLNYTLKYTLPSMGRFNNSLGVNGMYQSNKNKNATDFPIPDYHLFDFGGYLFSSYKRNKWSVSGGIRWDHRTVNGPDFYTASNPVSGFDTHVSGADTVGAYLQFPKLNFKYSGISASLGMAYAANDHLNVKVNIARGYRAPNITESASNGLDPGAHIVYIGNRDFKPEFNLQEDLSLDVTYPEFTGGVSIFHNSVSNYISLFQLTDADGNPVQLVPGNWTYQYQQTSAVLYGFEAYADYTPKAAPTWTIHSSVSSVYGKNTSARFKNKGDNGEYLSNIPPINWRASIEKTFPIQHSAITQWDVQADANVNGAQNRFFGLYNTETRTPGYTLLGLSSGLTWRYTGNHTIDFNLFASNILDKVYQSNLSRLKYFEYYAASPNGRLGIYGMGRNYGIKAILHF